MHRSHRFLPLFAAAFVFLLHATPAAAQWTGRGELGLVIASGNNETKAGNAKIAISHEGERWTHEGTFMAVYAADEVGSTAQRWQATEQSEYLFNPRNFWFGGTRYENDHFSGFTHQGTLSTGIGHVFTDSDTTQLKGQLGVGYKFFETREVLSPLGVLLKPRTTGNSLAGIANVDFKHQFNASTTLQDKFTAEYTSENTFLQNELSLQVKMTDALAIALGYTVRHNTDPPEGFARTDTLTTVNLVYEMK